MPLPVLGPVGAEGLLGPRTHGQAGGVGGAERGGLGDGRADDRDAQEVGLELHQGLVVDHAASTLRAVSVTPESLFMASSTSRVW